MKMFQNYSKESLSSKSDNSRSSMSEYNRKRIERERELSEHYSENSKILDNAKPTILSHAMLSLQQRHSHTSFEEESVANKHVIFDEKLEEKEEGNDSSEDEESSKSSDLFGIGDDE